MISFTKPSCKDCTKRTFDCHGKYESYLTWKREYDQARSELLKIRNNNRILETRVKRR